MGTLLKECGRIQLKKIQAFMVAGLLLLAFSPSCLCCYKRSHILIISYPPVKLHAPAPHWVVVPAISIGILLNTTQSHL